jgi:hypothetical protein
VWHHFVNLLSRSWSALVSAMGTTTLAIVAGSAGFVFILLINLVFKLRKDGWNWGVMMSHFSQNLRESLLPTMMSTFILWTALYGSFLIGTVYNDHQGLINDKQSLLRKNAGLVDPKSRDDEITDLKKQIAEVSQSRQAHQQLRIQMRYYTMEHNAHLEDGRTGKAFLVVGLTNKQILPVNVDLVCDHDIVPLNDAPELGVGGAYFFTGLTVVNSRTLELKIGSGSPAWAPEQPLAIPVFTEASDISCQFNLKQP